MNFKPIILILSIIQLVSLAFFYFVEYTAAVQFLKLALLIIPFAGIPLSILILMFVFLDARETKRNAIAWAGATLLLGFVTGILYVIYSGKLKDHPAL
jgi:heme/copper-type cytochrome/quinol oxidase subunit 4